MSLNPGEQQYLELLAQVLGVVVRQPLTLTQAAVENLEESPTLVLVAVDSRLDLLREIAEEDVGLAHHRTDAAHLEHQPLDYT